MLLECYKIRNNLFFSISCELTILHLEILSNVVFLFITFSGRIEPNEAFLAVWLRLICIICSNYVVAIVLIPLFFYAGRYICFI